VLFDTLTGPWSDDPIYSTGIANSKLGQTTGHAAVMAQGNRSERGGLAQR
jgi:hypothetical protein